MTLVKDASRSADVRCYLTESITPSQCSSRSQKRKSLHAHGAKAALKVDEQSVCSSQTSAPPAQVSKCAGCHPAPPIWVAKRALPPSLTCRWRSPQHVSISTPLTVWTEVGDAPALTDDDVAAPLPAIGHPVAFTGEQQSRPRGNAGHWAVVARCEGIW